MPTQPAAYATARQLIDNAHSADPNLTTDGKPAELVYADRVENWVKKLVPDAAPILLLAARCQHLERWQTPRNTYPEGKQGYFAWRRFLYTKQAERTKELLLTAGVDAAEADAAYQWVSKSDPKANSGTQALQDAAVLVFLENEIIDFAAQHADYSQEKFIDILRKSWRKLSPAAQQQALQLDLPPPIASLVAAAVGKNKQ